MEDKLMAKRSLLLLCWHHGLGHHLGDSAHPGECFRHLLCGVGHPHGCGEGLDPQDAGHLFEGDLDLLAAAATGADPAPTLPDKQGH